VVSLAIREFVQAGFARVGVVLGGFGGLTADQRAGLVGSGAEGDPTAGGRSATKNVSGLMKGVSGLMRGRSDSAGGGGGGGGGAASVAKNVSSGVSSAMSSAKSSLLAIGGGERKLSFGRRPRVDPAPSEGGDPFPAPGAGPPGFMVAQCPSCKRELRIPESSLASADANAFQCPGCSTRFMVARKDAGA